VILDFKTLGAILLTGMGTGLIVCMILRAVKTNPAGAGGTLRNVRFLVESAQAPLGPLWFAAGGAALGLAIVVWLAVRAGKD